MQYEVWCSSIIGQNGSMTFRDEDRCIHIILPPFTCSKQKIYAFLNQSEVTQTQTKLSKIKKQRIKNF